MSSQVKKRIIRLESLQENYVSPHAKQNAEVFLENVIASLCQLPAYVLAEHKIRANQDVQFGTSAWRIKRILAMCITRLIKEDRYDNETLKVNLYQLD
jgi:hypothetical protein